MRSKERVGSEGQLADRVYDGKMRRSMCEQLDRICLKTPSVSRAGVKTWLAEWLSNIHKALGLSPGLHQPSGLVCDCYPT